MAPGPRAVWVRIQTLDFAICHPERSDLSSEALAKEEGSSEIP
jgi:hypothetical protein